MVASPGNLERVELEAPEPLDGGQDRCRLRRERARRRQEVAADEEAPRVGGGDLQIGHTNPIVAVVPDDYWQEFARRPASPRAGTPTA